MNILKPNNSYPTKDLSTAMKLSVAAMSLSSLLILQGCGQDSSSASSEEGTVQIAITDAEEDFVSYRINISNVKFVAANGSEVSVLPMTTSMDFVQYQDISELFATLSIPAGVYTSVIMTLDYTGAEIIVEDADGNHVAASVVDGEGNAVTSLDVSMTLNDSEQFRVRRGQVSQLTLDLDLAASNTVLSTNPAVVEVEPFMLASAYMDEDRELRVRGLLNDVDEDADTFSANIFPMRLRSGNFGIGDVEVTDETLYEIDGIEYSGDEGLAVLDGLVDSETEQAVVAYGLHTDGEARIVANQVFAGSSVPWQNQDVLKGVISARSGDDITVRGAVVELEDGQASFGNEVTVTLDAETLVTGYRLGDADLSHLSVGQRIIALGDMVESDAERVFDAESVRLKISQVVGDVNAASPLTMDLDRYNGRRLEVFDFSGTGVDAANDVDVENFEVETFSLDTSNLESGDLIAVRGYAGQFASAPADFEAVSIIKPDFDGSIASFYGRWPLVDLNGGSGITVTEGVLNITDPSTSGLKFNRVPFNLTDQYTVNTLTALDDGQGRFAIRTGRGRVSLYRNYTDFSDALSAQLESGKQAKHVIAKGLYNETEMSLACKHITVSLR